MQTVKLPDQYVDSMKKIPVYASSWQNTDQPQTHVLIDKIEIDSQCTQVTKHKLQYDIDPF